MSDEVVRVGDKMQWSVELIEQVRENLEQRTEVVIVERIETGEDGLKTVWMKKAEWHCGHCGQPSLEQKGDCIFNGGIHINGY